MREKHVLSSAIQSKDAFDAVAGHVERADLSEQGWIIWECIENYYGMDGSAGSIDAELLAESVSRQVVADKHKTMFRDLVTSISTFESSPANVVDDLLATKREVKSHELANALLTGKDVETLLAEYDALVVRTSFDDEEATEVRQGYSVSTLVDTGFDPEGLIQVWPPSLNARLDGGVKPGHHLIVFGRPEMGKTLVVIEMMAGFVSQGLSVLYVGNEDPLDDVNMRVINRLALMTKFEVLNDPKEAEIRAKAAGYDLLIMAGLSPGTPREITGLIEKHTPDVLVLDQIRNLDMGNDNYTLALQAAAIQARTWAKRYSCVVVSVTQAGDSADGKAVLSQGDVDYSNTGIPATADVLLGIGATERNKMRGELVLSLPKNKVSGNHEFFAVLAEPTLSQLISLD